jgi:hypothetical protein
MNAARWSALLGLLLTLFAFACTDDRSASESDKRGGFYGGVSAGGTRP